MYAFEENDDELDQLPELEPLMKKKMAQLYRHTRQLCPNQLNTSMGVIHVVDKKGTYEEAAQYCMRRCTMLAPVNTMDKIKEVSTLLKQCHGRGRLHRFYRK